MIRLVIPALGFFTEPLKGHVGHSVISAIFMRNLEVAAGVSVHIHVSSAVGNQSL
jgi:hypothetical protein